MVLAATGLHAGVAAQARTAAPELNAYFGTTHAHTGAENDHGGDSSGAREIFGAARGAGFDFLFLTEHSGATGPEVAAAYQADAELQASRFSRDGRFVGFVGYEWSENGGDDDDDSGHMTGFGTPAAIDAGADGMTFGPFADSVAGAGGVAFSGFNHPPAAGHAGSAPENLTSRSRDAVVMSETSNRVREDPEDEAEYYEGFVAHLDRGWRVAPTCGLDGHGRWALRVRESDRRKPCRTGVLAPALTRADVLDAVVQRRMFSTRDTNLQVEYTVNDQWMGSTVGTPATASFDIRVEDPDVDDPRDAVTGIEVVGSGGTVLARSRVVDEHRTVWRPEIARGDNDYMFVRVFTGERTAHTAVAAPVWFE